MKSSLLIWYHKKIAILTHLPKKRRIAVGVLFMIFGFINMFNPFINGIIFLFGGVQVFLAKKTRIEKDSKITKKKNNKVYKEICNVYQRKNKKFIQTRKKMKEKEGKSFERGFRWVK